MSGSATAMTHPGELTLRRLRAGELAAAEAETARTHAEACVVCRARLRTFDDEQRAFEAEVPFERFSARVQERASRPRAQATQVRSLRYVGPALAMAALTLVAVSVGPWSATEDAVVPINLGTERPNRTKGDGALELRISAGDEGPQREASADAPEPLSEGERIRIGYRPGSWRYVLALAVDAQGEVSPLYPEHGESLPVQRAEEGASWLPDSVEFFGEGAERVILVLSDAPVSVDAAREAALRAFSEARGDVTRLPRLDLPGEQFHRTLLKP